MAKTKSKQIKSFEEACKAQGLDPEKALLDVSAYPKSHQSALIAVAKLIIIAEVLNDGWKPDWNNDDEYKYYPWFDMEKDSNNPSGFLFHDAYYSYAGSGVGSRLCFKTRELAEYAGTQFLDLYRDYTVL
jgi:hypothetical protein